MQRQAERGALRAELVSSEDRLMRICVYMCTYKYVQVYDYICIGIGRVRERER